MAKKVILKDKEGNKKIKIPIEKSAPKAKVLKRQTKVESKKRTQTHRTFRIVWDKVTNTVLEDAGDISELKVFVRIMAFDGKGKTILDKDKKNKVILEWEKLPKPSHKIIPKPWTFIEGTFDSQLELKQGEAWIENKKIDFSIPANDKDAKIGIRVDAIEFDGYTKDAPDHDNFDDNTWDSRVSEISKITPVKIVIREEEARLTFFFTITPMD